MSIDCIVAIVLATFFVICPLRKRNSFVDAIYRRIRAPLARIGLNHTAWTMFHSGTNRNHFLTVRFCCVDGSSHLELRQPWRHDGLGGDLVDERLRRVVLSVIRTETGPVTRKTMAQGLIRWCMKYRITAPADALTGQATYGQEVFHVPPHSRNKGPVGVTIKYTTLFSTSTNGQLAFHD